eukprot:GHVP01067239.1.p1 GENE.GHVP01067239.1~~GHVP01067239.1.p1  ORF type:complete len:278 (-),score=55.75 GHVP01067239.1:23-856(-)
MSAGDPGSIFVILKATWLTPSRVDVALPMYGGKLNPVYLNKKGCVIRMFHSLYVIFLVIRINCVFCFESDYVHANGAVLMIPKYTIPRKQKIADFQMRVAEQGKCSCKDTMKASEDEKEEEEVKEGDKKFEEKITSMSNSDDEEFEKNIKSISTFEKSGSTYESKSAEYKKVEGWNINMEADKEGKVKSGEVTLNDLETDTINPVEDEGPSDSEVSEEPGVRETKEEEEEEVEGPEETTTSTTTKTSIGTKITKEGGGFNTKTVSAGLVLFLLCVLV